MSTPSTEATPAPGERLDGLPEHVVIRQLYLGCLSQASYLVGDAVTGRAVAVDPQRDTDGILAAAAEDGLTIELVIETHFHADFLSGHLELAAATGAEIGIGAAGTTDFPSRPLADGQVVDLGGVQLEVWATPGHTPESISILVRPAPGEEPVAVLTGDTLFIGDVGRPDLLVSAGFSAADMGARLYHSVHRLLGLPDPTLVLPAHGAGSACGRAMSTETVSTMGVQRTENAALQPMSKEAFVAFVTEDQPAAPEYFGHDARLNRTDHPLLDEHTPPRELELADVEAAVASGAVLLDVRPVEDFAGGHLAGSINVSLSGRYAEQVGSVVRPGSSIVLIGDADSALEAKVRLGRIGFDDVVGVLTHVELALADDPTRARQLSRLTAGQFARRRDELGDRLQFVDVRNPSEVEAAPVAGAHNIPLARLRDRLVDLDPMRPVVLMCAGGARSAVASSLLLASGFADVSDIVGGAAALGGGPSSCSTA